MSGKTILVVDDDEHVRDIVVITLRRQGYTTVSAQDATEAQERLRDGPPDCMVLDALLPDRSGIELCAELKSDERTRSVRVLILSGLAANSLDGTEHWRREARADDFLSKPFRLADLLARVDKLLASVAA